MICGLVDTIGMWPWGYASTYLTLTPCRELYLCEDARVQGQARSELG